jgi:hypothetical protein
LDEILKNIFAGLAKANAKKYFFKSRLIYPSLWASYTFVYTALFRFILPMGSISTHSLVYTKVYQSYEHNSF